MGRQEVGHRTRWRRDDIGLEGGGIDTTLGTRTGRRLAHGSEWRFVENGTMWVEIKADQTVSWSTLKKRVHVPK